MKWEFNDRYLIIVIAFGTVIASLSGLILIPNSQFSRLKPVTITMADGQTVEYPKPADSFREAPGRKHYQSLGCIYCHSQQVRGEGFGADLDRGWGSRQSVPLDYIFQEPPFTGTSRTGPDLASIGQRQPSKEWHYLHLFDPQITSPGSVMAPHRFLFEEVDEAGFDTIALPEGYRKEAAWIIPKKDAVELVAYLNSLDQAHRFEDVNP